MKTFFSNLFKKADKPEEEEEIIHEQNNPCASIEPILNSEITICGCMDGFRFGDTTDLSPHTFPLDVSSLLSFSACDDHTVWVTKNGQGFAIGSNDIFQISGTLRKEKFIEEQLINIRDNNGEEFKFISAVCGSEYTLYLVSSIKKKYNQLLYAHIYNENTIFLNLYGYNPIALFGGCQNAAVIDSTGSIFIITKKVLENGGNVQRSYLPNDEKAICVACYDSIIIVASSSGKVFELSESSIMSNNFQLIKELQEEKIIEISGIHKHCIAVSKRGKVFGRGSNLFGRLGIGEDQKEANSFIEIASLNNYKIISASAGSFHSLFITYEGKVLACGSNNFGQLILKIETGNNNFYFPVETYIKKSASHCIAGNDISVVFYENEEPKNTPNISVSKMKLITEKQKILNENTVLKKEKESHIKEISKLKRENEVQRIEIAKIKSENLLQKSEIKRIMNENKAHNKEISRLKNENSSQYTEILRLKNEKDALNKEITKIKNENAKIFEEYKEIKEQLTKKECEISSLNSIINCYKVNIEELIIKQEELIKQKQQEESHIKDINELKDEIKKLKSKIKEPQFTFVDDDTIRSLEIVKEIGKGATSMVFEVNYPYKKRLALKRFKRELFVKEVKPDDDKNEEKSNNELDVDFIRKFFKEYEIMNSLDHPNIIKAHGFYLGNKTTSPSILLEYCPKVLKKEIKMLNDHERIRIIIEISSAMEKIHLSGIIHRDLKLENIFLDEDNHVKIGDFGFGTSIKNDDDSSISLTGNVGTFNYMAPEILDGRTDYNNKVDVFSFGVVVYLILTKDEGPKLSIINIVAQKIPIPSNISSFSAELVRKCLSIEASERPSFTEICCMLKKNENKII